MTGIRISQRQWTLKLSSKHIQFLPSYNNIKGSIFVFHWQNKTTYIFPECNTILLHNKRVRFHFSLTKQYHLQNSRTRYMYHLVTQQKVLFSLTEFQNIVLYSICMFLFSGYLNDSLMFCYDKTYFRLAESVPFSGKSRCIKF